MRCGIHELGGHRCRGSMAVGKGPGRFGARRGQDDRSGSWAGQGSGRGFGLDRDRRAISPGGAEAERCNLEMRAERLRREMDVIQKRMDDLSAPEAAKE